MCGFRQFHQRTGIGSRSQICKAMQEIAASAGDLSDERLQKRIKDAANYFIGQLNRFDEILEKMPQSHDNRRVELKLRDRRVAVRPAPSQEKTPLKFSQRRISPKTVTLISRLLSFSTTVFTSLHGRRRRRQPSRNTPGTT